MDLSRRGVLQLGGLGALAIGGMALPLSNAVLAKDFLKFFDAIKWHDDPQTRQVGET